MKRDPIPADPQAMKLAGEILALVRKGASRTGAEEMRLSELETTFGDHVAAGQSLVRAAMKNNSHALNILKDLRDKGN